MSTPDPRTEVADKIMQDLIHIYAAEGFMPTMKRLKILLADALTTEAARVWEEERNKICRQLVQRADELGASADAAIQQGDLSTPSDEQTYAAQQFKSMAKHLCAEAMEYRLDASKPTPCPLCGSSTIADKAATYLAEKERLEKMLEKIENFVSNIKRDANDVQRLICGVDKV